MRQGQQNRRGRGRGRKNQNPLSRNYESNGPDVKIRGTASHVAEKYSALARDALSSGDPITAENYFQHAEHYNRIIMAAQAQNLTPAQPATEATNGVGAPQPDLADSTQSEQETKSKSSEEAPRIRRRRPAGNNGAARRPAKPKVSSSSSEGGVEKQEKVAKVNGLESTDEVDPQNGEVPPDGIVV